MSQKATGQKPASAAKGTYASKRLLPPMLFSLKRHPWIASCLAMTQSDN
jgi:hypothetical protein